MQVNNAFINSDYPNRADDTIFRATVCSYPSSQVQQQSYEDGTSQELRLRELISTTSIVSLLILSVSTIKLPKLILRMQIIVISWILGVGLIGINIYFLSTSFVDWITHSSLPRPVTVLIGIVVFPFMAVYILAILYLAFRKDRVVTFVDKSDSSQIEMEDGVHPSDGNKATEVMPYREDLADIPLPN